MNENRDDTLPQADVVMAFFCRNMELAARNKMRDAFKAVWGNVDANRSPLEFKVFVEFERVLPDFILKAIEDELKAHGWTNFVFDVKEKDGFKQSTLSVMLDHDKASEYA